MATIGYPAAVQSAAIVVSRHQDNDIALHWRRRNLETGEVTDADTSGWELQATIESLTGTQWASWPCQVDAGGLVLVGPAMSVLSGSEWDGRELGRYRVTATKDGKTTLLAEDLIRIV